MELRDLSIQTKILLALAVTFIVLLIITATFISSSQRTLVTDLASEKVNNSATQTEETSISADNETGSGKEMTDKAISGIRDLIKDIGQPLTRCRSGAGCHSQYC